MSKDLVIDCPQCRHPVPVAAASRPPSFPFCSERCRLLDLGAWCDGERRIAGQPLASLITDAPADRP